MHFLVGDTAKFPVIYNDENMEEIIGLVHDNIALSKTDWNSQEISWEFERHCLTNKNGHPGRDQHQRHADQGG